MVIGTKEQIRYDAERQKLRREVVEAIGRGQKINIKALLASESGKPPIGDTIINTHVCYSLLRSLATEIGKKPPSIKLSIKEGFRFGQQVKSYDHSHCAVIHSSRLDEASSFVADALGMAVPPELLSEPPMIYPLAGYKPLENFNYVTVQKRAQKLEKSLRGKKLIVLCQAGSKSYKRFSNNHIAAIEEYVRTHVPDSQVIVLRDADIHDVNELAAYFYLSSTIITTDTAWSWIGGAVRRFQEQNRRKPSREIVFHSISSDYWHVPGSIAIYGPATKLTDPNDERSPGLLMDFQYSNYSKGRDIWAYDFTAERESGAKPDVAITDGDFIYFMKELQRNAV